MLKGLVINTQKNIYNVKTEIGVLRCTLRGKLLKNRQDVTSFIVVGDEVIVEKLQNDIGIILEICERKTKFCREVTEGNKNLEHIIASNIEQVIIVCSVKNPIYHLRAIDRFIVSAISGGIKPIVCFNKIDLINQSDLESDINYFKKRGFDVILTSVLLKESISELKEVLKNKISVFSGSSGVGKSSLINSIKEENIAKTNEVGDSRKKGKHTTTSSLFYDLPFGGMVLDTPGLRGFRVVDKEDEVKNSFQDIQDLSQMCKFNDCSHTVEPKCAVRDALDNGEIDEKIYKNYIRLMKSLK